MFCHYTVHIKYHTTVCMTINTKMSAERSWKVCVCVCVWSRLLGLQSSPTSRTFNSFHHVSLSCWRWRFFTTGKPLDTRWALHAHHVCFQDLCQICSSVCCCIRYTVVCDCVCVFIVGSTQSRHPKFSTGPEGGTSKDRRGRTPLTWRDGGKRETTHTSRQTLTFSSLSLTFTHTLINVLSTEQWYNRICFCFFPRVSQTGTSVISISLLRLMRSMVVMTLTTSPERWRERHLKKSWSTRVQ